MTQTKQLEFYCLQDREHWKYMDLDVMKAKVQGWITLERKELKKGKQDRALLNRLIKVRQQINYSIKNGIKPYQIGRYEFKDKK